MPLIPNSNNKQTQNDVQGQEKGKIHFLKSSPVYTFDDLILGEKILDELKTVVSAQKTGKPFLRTGA